MAQNGVLQGTYTETGSWPVPGPTQQNLNGTDKFKIWIYLLYLFLPSTLLFTQDIVYVWYLKHFLIKYIWK